MIQNVLNQSKGMAKSPKNICYGSAKTVGDSEEITPLAADVDLVASGVSKDCKDEDLFQFLKDKGINPVSVVTLTRDEVLDQVRKKTFKVTVKAAQYEAALRPDVWPYRVVVRHFRAPRKQDETWNSQAGRSGGLIENANKNTRQQNGNSSLGLKKSSSWTSSTKDWPESAHGEHSS